MRTLFFALPCLNIAVTAPEEALGTLSLFYPFHIEEQKPDFIACAYRIEKKDKRWALFEDGKLLNKAPSALQSVLNLEYAIETALLRHRGKRLAIHAGCVAIKDKACLITGNPEAGKTAVTFHLVEMGHRFMCEEIAFVDTETKEVHPFPQTLALESVFIEEAKRVFPLRRGEVHPLGPYLVRYSPERVQKEPVEAGTILVPSRDPGIPTGITSLRPGGFLTEFLSYCFEPEGDTESFMDNAISLLEKCRILRLCYRDVTDCRRLLLSLFPETRA